MNKCSSMTCKIVYLILARTMNAIQIYLIWQIWKSKFFRIWDKHAQVKRRMVGSKGLPWLTTDLIYKKRYVNFLNKKAKTINTPKAWTAKKKEKIGTRSVHMACLLLYLTNRFYFCVRLYCNRSQMTSWRVKNKKVRTRRSRVP